MLGAIINAAVFVHGVNHAYRKEQGKIKKVDKLINKTKKFDDKIEKLEMKAEAKGTQKALDKVEKKRQKFDAKTQKIQDKLMSDKYSFYSKRAFEAMS